ncbi:MAG: ANTAR domain-containing response regulator [Candidatus Binatia bacterium]
MKKVLVIDDHEPSRRQLIQSLHGCGYKIAAEGCSGRVASALARASAAEVIVMAVGLVDLDGIDAAREIMQSDPLPIVLVTSHADPSTVARATNAGVMSYLVKPLRVEELAPAIELAVSRFREFVSLRDEVSTLKLNLEERKLIERAKGLLMEQRHLSEERAYSLMKKASMNMRKPMSDIAQAILLAGGLLTDSNP